MKTSNANGNAFHRLEALIRDLDSADDSAQHHFGFSSSFRSNEVGEFGMNERQGEEYFSIVDLLAPDSGRPPVRSRTVIDRALAGCILTALTPEKNSTTSFDQRTRASIAELKRSLSCKLKEWEVWRFVDKIKVPADGFQFGKVLFCDHSHESAKPVSGKIAQAVERAQKLRLTSPSWPTKVAGHTLCRITLKAGDKDAALDLAEFELTTTLNILNFFASLIHVKGRWPALSSQACNSSTSEFRFYFEQGSKNWGYHTTMPRFRETFDPSIIPEDRHVEIAFHKVNSLLSSASPGLSDRFLSALKWAGKGSISENREDAFVFYAIALEALLLGQQHKEQLAYRLRLRAAHLLGLKSSARSRIRDRVNLLYGLRSKIVHCGRTEISQADLDELRLIVQSCIIRLLSDPIFNKCSGDAEIEAWFENRIISGPDETDARPQSPEEADVNRIRP